MLELDRSGGTRPPVIGLVRVMSAVMAVGRIDGKILRAREGATKSFVFGPSVAATRPASPCA